MSLLVKIGPIVLWLYSSIHSETAFPPSKSFISLKHSSVIKSPFCRPYDDARFRQFCSKDLDIKKCFPLCFFSVALVGRALPEKETQQSDFFNRKINLVTQTLWQPLLTLKVLRNTTVNFFIQPTYSPIFFHRKSQLLDCFRHFYKFFSNFNEKKIY